MTISRQFFSSLASVAVAAAGRASAGLSYASLDDADLHCAAHDGANLRGAGHHKVRLDGAFLDAPPPDHVVWEASTFHRSAQIIRADLDMAREMVANVAKTIPSLRLRATAVLGVAS
jgi:uncharacterized protein YjbI with pentapeptide repeats